MTNLCKSIAEVLEEIAKIKHLLWAMKEKKLCKALIANRLKRHDAYKKEKDGRGKFKFEHGIFIWNHYSYSHGFICKHTVKIYSILGYFTWHKKNNPNIKFCSLWMRLNVIIILPIICSLPCSVYWNSIN